MAGFADHSFACDSRGEPIRIAAAPWLDPGLDCGERCAALLEEALDDALEGEVGGALGPAVGVVLALPAARPGLDPGLAEALSRRLAKRRDLHVLQALGHGHASGFAALAAAAEAMRRGSVKTCIVAGVDSWLEPETLQWLERADLLHGAGELNNAWGRVPGEAAAVLVLKASDAGKPGEPSLTRITSVGLAREPHVAGEEGICIGHGLTQAFQAALRPLPAQARVDDVVCDMNGERYRANEFAFAALRSRERLREAGDFIAPADTWGDVGAASGPLAIIAATVAALKHYANGPWALAWASSDGAERGAALLDRSAAEV